MKIEVKKIDGTKREVAVEVSGDVVQNKFEDVFKKIAQEAKVPGFRIGKAPRDILEKHYSSQADELVLKELIPDLYKQAVEREGLDAIELPDISDVKLNRSCLSFKAIIEIRPQIAVGDYRKLKVIYKTIAVSPDELKRNMDSLKEKMKVDTIDDTFAKSLGYPNLRELEKSIERQLIVQKEAQQRQGIENEIIENLSKDLEFKLPEALINRQLQDMLKQAKLDLVLEGLPPEEINEGEKELSKNLQPQARKQVKAYLILAEIARKENIPFDEHMPQRVIELLLREADWQETS